MPTEAELLETILKLERQSSMTNDALEAALAVSPERDNNFFTGGLSALYDTRNSWDRKKIFAESLRAWRVNPMARRIVRLLTSYTVGKGVKIKSDDPTTEKFLQSWWEHPRNQLQRNIKRWKDEDTRTGNLFILFNVLEDGMTILRAVPADQIEEIKTNENDIEQETSYLKDSAGADFYNAYNPSENQTLFMMHFASNQPIGSPWGEADLSPLLVWIGRYSSWLEDRVRLNKYRTAFMYVINGAYASEEERKQRETYMNAHPPKSGSVLVLNSNNGEDWGILSASLDSFDATMDGSTIKKMFAGGIGIPMHWLAEGESSISTTAEAAGTPTFRTLEEMQNDFFETLVSLARTACEVRARTDSTVKPKSKIWIEGPDITERDNASLALALGRAYPHLAELFDRDAIDAKEFMRLIYKQFAEVWDETKSPNIKKKPLIDPKPNAKPEDDPGTDETDPKEEETLAAKLFKAMPAYQPPNISVHMPEQSAPNVTVEPQNIQVNLPPSQVDINPQINVQPADVQIHVPMQEKPVVNVNLPKPERRKDNIIVNVAAPSVQVTNDVNIPETEETMIVERDREGRAAKIKKTTKRKEG